MQKEWNNFWKNNQDRQFTNPSWSKRRIMKILDKYIKSEMTVLDAGCGSGFFSNYFILKGCRVYSLDYSEEALTLAKRMTNNRSFKYLKKNLLKNNLTSEFKNKFDLIFTDGLFEHFTKQEQEQIMGTFVKIKKDKGIVVTIVPNKYTFWTFVRPFFMPEIKEKPFSLNELESFVKKSGQDIMESGGINVLPIRYSPEFLGKKVGMLVLCYI
ncbi:class I SAM-dependent methyltransferase [candidate division WOR-3 bacterium]|nr:class I SAM-dependent methyltransferase [candidate division WOR-3 bacterium]